VQSWTCGLERCRATASRRGWRDRQKNSILVELTVCQKNVANVVVIILKNKVQFVTFPFFFMVKLQKFLSAPRSSPTTSNVLPSPTDVASVRRQHRCLWSDEHGLPLSATVLFRSQEVVSGTVCHVTSHHRRLSLFSESALKHFCSHVHSLLNFDLSVHRLVV